MQMGRWILLMGALLLLGGCQQPYRVFAVQVAAADEAPPPLPGALADARPLAVAPVAAPTMGGLGMRMARPKWDLNRVPAVTLMELPGMTPGVVTAIINGRPYRGKRELLKRKILTAEQYARWKDYLVVHRTAATSRGSAATRR